MVDRVFHKASLMSLLSCPALRLMGMAWDERDEAPREDVVSTHGLHPGWAPHPASPGFPAPAPYSGSTALCDKVGQGDCEAHVLPLTSNAPQKSPSQGSASGMGRPPRT